MYLSVLLFVFFAFLLLRFIMVFQLYPHDTDLEDSLVVCEFLSPSFHCSFLVPLLKTIHFVKEVPPVAYLLTFKIVSSPAPVPNLYSTVCMMQQLQIVLDSLYSTTVVDIPFISAVGDHLSTSFSASFWGGLWTIIRNFPVLLLGKWLYCIILCLLSHLLWFSSNQTHLSTTCVNWLSRLRVFYFYLTVVLSLIVFHLLFP